LRIPPLRERRQDIPLLAANVIDRLAHTTGRNFELTDDAMKALLGYDWPGNVRELENCLERCCAMISGSVINALDLPTSITGAPALLTTSAIDSRVMPMAEVEKQAIMGAITRLNGDKLMAAKLLGIGKTTLYRKLKRIRSGLLTISGVVFRIGTDNRNRGALSYWFQMAEDLALCLRQCSHDPSNLELRACAGLRACYRKYVSAASQSGFNLAASGQDFAGRGIFGRPRGPMDHRGRTWASRLLDSPFRRSRSGLREFWNQRH
jgi:hypothetical protein